MENVIQANKSPLSMTKETLDESLVIPLDGYADQEDDVDRGKRRFYGFKLNELQLLLDADVRSEVINDADVVPLPLMQEFVKGLCNVRGNLVPVYDMRNKLGLEQTSVSSNKKKVLILGENENMAGIEIHDMVVSLEFDEKDIQREIFSGNQQLDQCISYSYQQDGSNWFGFEYEKLFNIVD